MNALRFTPETLQTWADFSGDYNPIHFDDHIARVTIGKGGRVIHGMLAMLPLKASHSAMTWEGGDWLQWTGMLRQAMPLGSAYTMEARTTRPGTKIRFKLSAVDDAEAKITGHCSILPFDSKPYAAFRRVDVPLQEVQAELERFTELFPGISPAWIAIDAMIFSRYLRLHAGEIFREQLSRHFGDSGQDMAMEGRLLTMQTQHVDTIERSLLASLHDLTITSFAYGYAKTEEFLTEDSVFATVDLPVWINGALVQVVQIGLMARDTSSFSQPQEFSE